MSKKDVHEDEALRVPINWIQKSFDKSTHRRLSKSPLYDAREVHTVAYACSQSSLSPRHQVK